MRGMRWFSTFLLSLGIVDDRRRAKFGRLSRALGPWERRGFRHRPLASC